jgi:tetratricopeptide (TPR) repeat protein
VSIVDPDHADSSLPPGGAEVAVSVSGSRGVQVGDHNIQTNVEVDASKLLPPQTVSAGQVVHNLPLATAAFVGRDLEGLAGLLLGEESGVVVGQAAVHGLGGIGKTELVAHYARAYLDRFTLVWWITADSRENVALGLAALTRRLHHLAILADAQEWAIGWLQSHTGWLLVLDNVEDLDHIRPLLGQVTGRGQLVVTTRRDLGAARWATLGLVPLQLGVLARTASVELLTRLTGRPDQRDAAGRLAAELGDLPLALEQAAAYITQHDGMDFDGYRQRLARQFVHVAAHAGEGGTPERTISGVWQVTMAEITSRSDLAARVMDVVAWLAPEALPEDVLVPLGEEPPEVTEAVALLASYNMITRSGGMLSVHRLVQAVTRTAARSAESGEDPASAAVDLLAMAVPGDPVNNVNGWTRWNLLLPHIDALVSHLDASRTNETLLNLAERAATYREYQGQLPAAISQFEQVLISARRILGADHHATLTIQNNLAGAYRKAGRVGDAIDLYGQVLTTTRRIAGVDRPAMLILRHNLAGAYQELGRVGDAISQFEQVLADELRVLGADHPSTLTTQNDLAGAYRAAGRVGDAIDLYEQTLADRVRVLGADHPSTLTTQNDLAVAYRAAGRVADAIDLYEQVLADQVRLLGVDHPDTLILRHNLAVANQAAGRVNAAIAQLEQLLADRRRVLGADHPSTLTTQNELAAAYRAAGRVSEAIDLYELVLADRRRVLGADHPSTLITQNDLAIAYRAAGRVSEAIDLYELVLADRVRVLGADHPSTLITQNDLAIAYRAAGRVGDAIDLHEQVLTAARRVLGDNHPETLTLRHNLAGTYHVARRVSDAITQFEQTLTDRRQVLGADHPSTLTTQSDLAVAYQAAGRISDAISRFEQTLTAARRKLGDNHQLTQAIVVSLDAARRQRNPDASR